jgi:Ca2+-binding RTX toxin-like protein
MARLNGSNDPNRIEGTRDDDTINGYGGDDRLNGYGGDDKIAAGIGDDRVNGGAGDDWLDGGWGDDRVDGGRGDDTLVYVAQGNQKDRDWYSGGHGNDDTLRLEFTRDEWKDDGLRRELERYEDWIDSRHGEGNYNFREIGLHASGFENVEVVVDGHRVDLQDNDHNYDGHGWNFV